MILLLFASHLCVLCLLLLPCRSRFSAVRSKFLIDSLPCPHCGIETCRCCYCWLFMLLLSYVCLLVCLFVCVCRWLVYCSSVSSFVCSLLCLFARLSCSFVCVFVCLMVRSSASLFLCLGARTPCRCSFVPSLCLFDCLFAYLVVGLFLSVS